MNMFRQATFIAACVSFLAAGASSKVLVGKARPAIAPDQVKIYLHPPAKYEEVAILEASSKNSLAITSQGKMNKVMERLKAEAAALGANDVLLQGTGNEYEGLVNTGTGVATVSGNNAHGSSFGTPAAIMQKAGTGIAIYVTEQ